MLDQRLSQAIGEILRIEADTITPETSQQNTASWDSMAHFELILHIEDAFGIRFRSDEISSLTSVESIQQALERLGVK
jgi:acyl carrier protein